MHIVATCTLSLYDVIGITRHLHIKLKSFSNITQPLHKKAVRGCSFLYIIGKKSVIMSEAFLVDVSIKQKSELLRSLIKERAFINSSATTRKSKQKLMLSKIRFSLP